MSAPASAPAQHAGLSQLAISYTTHPRARRLRIRIDPVRRAAIVTAPPGRSAAETQAFVARHAAWIDKELKRLAPAQPFVEGGEILLHGVAHRLTRSAERGRATVRAEGASGPTLDVPALADAYAGRVRRALVHEARTTLTAQSDRFAAQLGRAYASLTVRDTGTRWGSCSASGGLSYSWRLVCAPPEVLAYVAAHEVAHLVHRHHGPAFWAQVAQLFGDPSQERAWLRTNAGRLFAVGALAP